MAIINADGLFNGERFERVSDDARYAWPYLWCASNTLGRIELNYRSIVGRIFSRFKKVPTEEQFWGWIREFQQAYLLFVYEAAGALWGQWQCSEKVLATYKLAADLASPGPDSAAIDEWRDSYIREKQSRNRSKPIAVNDFENVLKTLPKDSRNISKVFSYGEDRRGEGKPSASGDARGSISSRDQSQPFDENLPFDTLDDLPAPEQNGKPDPVNGRAPRTSANLPQEQDQWFAAWWGEYWLHKAKKPAREAFRKQVKTKERFQQVMAATRAQGPEMLSREPSKRPHGATWLNAERWDDEIASPVPGSHTNAGSIYTPETGE